MVLNILKNQMTSVVSLRSDLTGRKKIVVAILNLACFVSMLIYWTTITWYFAFEAHELIEYLESAYFVIISTTELALYLQMILMQKSYKQLFKDLDLIVEESKNYLIKINFFRHDYITDNLFSSVGCQVSPLIRLIYEQVNQKVEKYTGMICFAFIKIIGPCNILVPALISFSVYIYTGFSREALIRFIPAT